MRTLRQEKLKAKLYELFYFIDVETEAGGGYVIAWEHNDYIDKPVFEPDTTFSGLRTFDQSMFVTGM